MSTYTIAKSIGLDESYGLDDTTLEIAIAVFVVVIMIGIGVVFFMMTGKSEATDSSSIIEAIAASNQSKLPVTLNINTSPVYYPK